jgi:translation initiation factor IF-2
LTKERTDDEKPTVRLILRADVDGTLEAIQNVLDTYEFAEVDLQIVDASVGPPFEELIEIAAEFKGLYFFYSWFLMKCLTIFMILACIYCFNTPVPAKVRMLANERGVEIEQYNIIYKLVDALKLRLDTTYGPITEMELAGEGHVLRQFVVPDRDRKKQPIAGTLVDWGVLTK